MCSTTNHHTHTGGRKGAKRGNKRGKDARGRAPNRGGYDGAHGEGSAFQFFPDDEARFSNGLLEPPMGDYMGGCDMGMAQSGPPYSQNDWNEDHEHLGFSFSGGNAENRGGYDRPRGARSSRPSRKGRGKYSSLSGGYNSELFDDPETFYPPSKRHSDLDLRYGLPPFRGTPDYLPPLQYGRQSSGLHRSYAANHSADLNVSLAPGTRDSFPLLQSPQTFPHTPASSWSNLSAPISSPYVEAATSGAQVPEGSTGTLAPTNASAVINQLVSLVRVWCGGWKA